MLIVVLEALAADLMSIECTDEDGQNRGLRLCSHVDRLLRGTSTNI